MGRLARRSGRRALVRPNAVAGPRKVSAADETGRHPADPHDSQLFTGSIEAIQRSKAFTGPGEEVFEDRDKSVAAQN